MQPVARVEAVLRQAADPALLVLLRVLALPMGLL
jgi:hypothetical protein